MISTFQNADPELFRQKWYGDHKNGGPDGEGDRGEREGVRFQQFFHAWEVSSSGLGWTVTAVERHYICRNRKLEGDRFFCNFDGRWRRKLLGYSLDIKLELTTPLCAKWAELASILFVFLFSPLRLRVYCEQIN